LFAAFRRLRHRRFKLTKAADNGLERSHPESFPETTEIRVFIPTP
jgi:hypothetical protein